jgi:hypothetical protein
MVTLNDIGKPTFGGHEKFVFRHGWLKKGVDAAAVNPTIFSEDDALVVLGVGKNMVRAIRHWCLATGLLTEKEDSGRIRSLQPTKLADKLIADKGWDPYCEDAGTLWLLHWQLISNPIRALIWHLTFSAYYESEFTKRQLAAYVDRQLGKLGVSTTPQMIDRDIDTCLRMYVPGLRPKVGGISEDSLDCPLVELDLIRFTPEDNTYRFNVGPKITLPAAVFGYALLTFLATNVRHHQTVAVEDCIYQAGSPGQAFKLDENSVMDYLETLEELTDGSIRLQESAGLRQIYLSSASTKQPQHRALELLEYYYGRHDL